MSQGIYCFTQDLRLEDNAALNQLSIECDRIAFVYIINPNWFRPLNYQQREIGEHRWRFICQSLQALASNLSLYGHKLHVVYGEPHIALAPLIEAFNLSHIGVANSVGLNERRAWRAVDALKQVRVVSAWQSTLLQAEQLPTADNSFVSFTHFRKAVEQPEITIDPPLSFSGENLPRSLTLNLPEFDFKRELALGVKSHPVSEKQVPFAGGELPASRHLRSYFSSQAPLSYKQTRNALDEWSSSTKLSPYLSQGNLSARQVWQQKQRYEAQFGANESTYWIGFELLWREYFQWLALRQGSKLFTFKGNAKKAPLTTFSPERFIKWQQGTTPCALVNACMNQLRETGYMSNRGRQIVASYLVNELALDWRYGAAYFQAQLIDYDVAANWGNWQYIAGVGVDPRGGRHFSIEKQQQRYDPNQDFIHRWQGEQGATNLDSVDAADWPVALAEG
ncbi:DASH family cryptochrome [Thalassotalea sp. LPB0316]|uniref:DASH family cryptochrome n=1 Tax=Thalassotalea sp. LPB0316 TaxID=2769490 RepID=UPI001866A881|nr:DASH family cryptochrome [Thalassotalea sp. LPB0316]QOL25609.1 DASH family cryptochrome [Thalassotalea sp. LPB0316]